MILKHHNDICDSNKTTLFDDNVVKGVIRRLTPEALYVDNQEFIDSFAITLVNYSPVSLNIIDYWNKDIIDNSAFIPAVTSETYVNILQPFEFAESTPEVDENYGKGFLTEKEPQTGGLLVDIKGNFDSTPHSGNCPNENEKRFWINSTIGLQDKLAYTHMNNFYMSVYNTTKDTVISQRIYTILKNLGLSTDGLFGNTNSFFTEEKYLANRHLNTKKGTAAAVKYVGRSVNDAQLQGQVPLVGEYYMNITEDAPFEYSVESNTLGVLFERFIKPLTHPIGMIYNYRTVCTSEDANKTEYPLVDFEYSHITLFVECLCFALYEEDNPIPPPGTEIECIFGSYPEKKVFASPDGTGLWDGISQDEGTGNIIDSYEDGTIYYENTPGVSIPLKYKKWNFENKNYIVQYKKESLIHNTSAKIRIEYYRYNGTDWDVAAVFENDRHCGINIDKDPIKKSFIDEDFNNTCLNVTHGMFQFLDKNETTPPETPAASGMYEGFISDLDNDENPDEYTGGVLNEFTDLYYGNFQFLDKKEEQLPNTDWIWSWPNSGLREGFNESYLLNQEEII